MFGTPHERALRRLVRRYQDAVLANPRDLGVRMKLAHTFQLLGRTGDATDELTIVAKLAARAGRGLEALATLQAILALDPGHTETQQLLSSLFARDGGGRVVRAVDEDEELTDPSRVAPVEPVFLLTTPSDAKDAVIEELDIVTASDVVGEEEVPREISEHDIVGSIDDEVAVSRAQLPLFGALSPAAFESLVTKLKSTRFPKNGIVFEEGAPGDSVLLLVSGRVRVEKLDGNERVHIASLVPGAFFGEFGYLTDRRRHARVVAETTVEVLEATRPVIEEVSARHPEIRETMLELYGRRLVETMSLFSPALRVLSTDARARWLARFARRSFARGTRILEEGTRGDGLYVILRGDADVEKRKKNGELVRVATLRGGDFFGEASLLTGLPVMASVRATSDLEALRLPPRELADLLAEAPQLRAVLQEAAVERKLFTESLVAGRAQGTQKKGDPVLL